MTQLHGRAVTEAAQGEAAQSLKNGGDATIGARSLSLGDGTHGSPVGKMDAVYSRYTLTSTDIAIVVPHTLGRIPNFAHLMSQEVPAGSPANAFATITLINRSQWTTNTFRANVAASASQAGIVLTFIVG